jgi:MFS family permease
MPADALRHTAASSFASVFSHLWKLPEFRKATLVAALAGIVGYGVLGWGPTFFVRVHELTPGQVGIRFGLLTAAALVTGNCITAAVADRAGSADLGGYMRVAGVGILLSVPCSIAMLFSPSAILALVALFAMMTLQVIHVAPCIAVIQTVAPQNMRAQASVIFGIVQTLTGVGFAPLAIGFLNDILAPAFGYEAVRYSLAIICVAAVAAGVLALRRTGTRNGYVPSSAREPSRGEL